MAEEENYNLYNGDLNLKALKLKPILMPIAKINSLYVTHEYNSNNALSEYEDLKKVIDDMAKANPRYKETRLYNQIMKLMNIIKNLVYSLDQQKEAMKNSINDMIDICEEDYTLNKIGVEDFKPAVQIQIPIAEPKQPKQKSKLKISSLTQRKIEEIPDEINELDELENAEENS